MKKSVLRSNKFSTVPMECQKHVRTKPHLYNRREIEASLCEAEVALNAFCARSEALTGNRFYDIFSVSNRYMSIPTLILHIYSTQKWYI